MAKTVKYSVNKKLNTLLNTIREQILALHDTQSESLTELVHYMKEFPNEHDYNLVQYGNLLIYYYDIRNMYIECGYKAENWTDSQVWETYKRQTGWVAREIAKEFKLKTR